MTKNTYAGVLLKVYPSREELKALYADDKNNGNRTQLLKGALFVWSGDLRGSKHAYLFSFFYNKATWDGRHDAIKSAPFYQAFAVRARK